jgi:hypothetical protein
LLRLKLRINKNRKGAEGEQGGKKEKKNRANLLNFFPFLAALGKYKANGKAAGQNENHDFYADASYDSFFPFR